jgi:ABC-2 type transport system permease protein
MKGYWALFKVRFCSLLQYRGAALAGVVTQLFWGIMRVMIFAAFYAHASSSTPMSLQETINYIWLSQVLLRLVPWHVDRDVEKLFLDGNVAYELVRPLNIYTAWFARIVALRLTPTLLAGVPMFLIALLFLDLSPPASIASGGLFIVAFCGALLVSAAFTAMVTILSFWTLSGEGVAKLMPHLVSLLSGLVIPLPLFPEWTQRFMTLQPFRALFDTPIRIYMGNIPVDQVFGALFHQFFWLLTFFLLGKLLLRRALKYVVIQGG